MPNPLDDLERQVPRRAPPQRPMPHVPQHDALDALGALERSGLPPGPLGNLLRGVGVFVAQAGMAALNDLSREHLGVTAEQLMTQGAGPVAHPNMAPRPQAAPRGPVQGQPPPRRQLTPDEIRQLREAQAAEARRREATTVQWRPSKNAPQQTAQPPRRQGGR